MASRPGREQGTEGDRGWKTGLSEVQAAENVACRVSPREPEEERMVGDTRRKTGGTGSPPPPFSLRIYKDLFYNPFVFFFLNLACGVTHRLQAR